ncbi:response regulator transcription factor [Hyphobacterium sp. CCMP332]|nr:response regulator transcription factor [Hyphobacterium sp. CCMP332]
MKKRILLIEDDQNLGFLIQDQLQQHGFIVEWFKDGESGKNSFIKNTPDICLLDVMLPKSDGFSLARKFRLKDQITPILFLTARDLLEDKLNAFKSGADDYITKPFSMEELMYRINVFLKRTANSHDAIEPSQYSHKNLIIDFRKNLLKITKDEIKLTEKEKDLFKILISNKDRIVKREEILLNIWGDDDYFKGRSLDVFISKLRKYLNKSSNRIINYHSIGFKWEEA